MQNLALPWWAPVVAFGGVCGAALWKGGLPERLVALALLLSMGATYLLRDRSWAEPQWAGLAIDLGFFFFLLILALRTDRFWPLWAAGFELLAVVTHGARLVDPTLGDWVYITATVIWTYLVLTALAIGTWNAWRARQVLESSRERGVRSPPRAQ